MTGSNGSPPQRGGHVPQQWQTETEEQVRAREYERWLELQRAQQPHQAPPGHHDPLPGHAGFADYQPGADVGAHGHPHNGGHPQAPYHDPAGAYPPARHPGEHGGGYAPNFEPFAPGHPQQPDYHAPQEPPFDPRYPASGHPAEPVHHGYQHSAGGYAGHGGEPPYHQGQQPFPPHHAPHGTPPGHDPNAYDLSHYAPGQLPPGYEQHHPGAHGHEPVPQHAGWPPMAPEAMDPQMGGRHAGQHWPPMPDQGQYAPHPGAATLDARYGDEPGYDPHGDYQDDYEHEPLDGEPERKGPSTLVIVGALVGAIVAGGGMAYAYKMLGGGGSTRPPVVKADDSPTKTAPADPGGKSIAHSDKTFINRVGGADQRPVPTSLQPESVPEGPRKVQTTNIIINRDNTISPQVSTSSDSGTVVANSGVPGLVIDGLGPPPGAAPPQPPPATRVAIPPPPPVRPTLPPPPAAAEQVAQAAPIVKKVTVVPAKTPVPKRTERDDLLAAKSAVGVGTAPPARQASVGSAGYVAVLASKRNRQDALNSFADFFQKYPDVLAGKTPDVRQVNLPNKGIWYRLIVGPPGSRQSARDLCVQLKTRGMNDCWPVAY